MTDPPRAINLKRDEGLLLTWPDGREDFLPLALLRRMSPSAEQRELRQQIARNPLTVLPSNPAAGSGPLRATDAELIGNYAIRIRFSDGHHTGIYSWAYLRELALAEVDRQKSPEHECPDRRHDKAP